MTTKAQSKPARSKAVVTRKARTRRPAAESTIPAPSKPKTTQASAAKASTAASMEPASAVRPKPSSKLGIVLALVEKPQGASLAMLVEVTGWLPHTTRAALTGLRKRGFAVVSEKSAGGGASVYCVRSEVA